MKVNPPGTYYSKDKRHLYKAIEVYKEVKYPLQWLNCKICGLKPLIWEFDNGRSTACGCGVNEFMHFSIRAESIMSVMKHSFNGMSMAGYNEDELKDNWNHWVKTGEIKCSQDSLRAGGRW